MVYTVLLYHTIFYYSVLSCNSLNTAIIYSITYIYNHLHTYPYIYIIRDLLSPLLDDSSSKKNWCYRPPHGHHGRCTQDGGEYIAQILMFHRHQICWRRSSIWMFFGDLLVGKKNWAQKSGVGNVNKNF